MGKYDVAAQGDCRLWMRFVFPVLNCAFEFFRLNLHICSCRETPFSKIIGE